MTAKAALPVVGIFVGGASSRMGGHPKGLLHGPSGETIVGRWQRLCEEVGLPFTLVGDAGTYAHLGIDNVPDERPGQGPLGGLVGLLTARAEPQIIAVACDMPYVTADLLRRLAVEPSDRAVVAPREGALYQPLFARYEAARVLPLARRQLDQGDGSLQRLLRTVGAAPFALSEEEARLLADWDEPADTGR